MWEFEKPTELEDWLEETIEVEVEEERIAAEQAYWDSIGAYDENGVWKEHKKKKKKKKKDKKNGKKRNAVNAGPSTAVRKSRSKSKKNNKSAIRASEMYATQASGLKNTTFSTELNRSIQEGNVLFDTRL